MVPPSQPSTPRPPLPPPPPRGLAIASPSGRSSSGCPRQPLHQRETAAPPPPPSHSLRVHCSPQPTLGCRLAPKKNHEKGKTHQEKEEPRESGAGQEGGGRVGRRPARTVHNRKLSKWPLVHEPVPRIDGHLRRHHRQGVAGGRCSTPTAVPVGPRHRINREGGGGLRRGGAVAAAGYRFTARRSPGSLPRSAPPAAAAPGGRLRRHRDDAHGRWVPTRPTRGREVPLANCTALRAGRRFRGRERAATYVHASNFETLERSNLHRLNAGQRVTPDRVIAQRSW